MSRTPFSQKNQEFTDKAHEAAKIQIYPKLLGTDNLEFERFSVGNKTERDRILDGEFGIDVRATAHYKDILWPMTHTFQERFRRADKSFFRDITITLFNGESGLLSEITKLNALWFLYGYYNDETNQFIEVVLINVPDLLLAISSGKVSGTEEFNPRSGQGFLTVRFESLRRAATIRYHLPFHPDIGNYAFSPPSSKPSTLSLLVDDMDHLKAYIYETNRVVKDMAGTITGIKNLIFQLSEKIPLVRRKTKQATNGDDNNLPLFRDNANK